MVWILCRWLLLLLKFCFFFPSKFSFQKPNCVTQSPWYGMLCKLNGWMYIDEYVYIYWRIRPNKPYTPHWILDIYLYMHMCVSDRLLKNYIFYGFGWCVVYLVKFFFLFFSFAHFPRARISIRFGLFMFVPWMFMPRLDLVRFIFTHHPER